MSLAPPRMLVTDQESVMTTSTRKVFVLGATGGIGGEMARQMRDAGWEVHAARRGTSPSPQLRDGITWISADALDGASVAAAARGAAVIVHAVNPPGYRNWPQVVLPMLDNTIAAARSQRATLILPGTIYNYGPDAFPVLRESSPQNPQSRKGAIRVAMEERLKDFAADGGRVIVVRAGDFFGPQVGNSWFSQGLVKPHRPVTRIYNPGSPGVGHQWSYVPDVARTMIELVDRGATLPSFASFHMAGHWDANGSQMIEAIQRVVTRRTGKEPRVSTFPWWLLTVTAPFVRLFREMREMRYLWQEPLRMDNAQLLETLGHEPHTQLDVAVEATLEGLGCLRRNGAALESRQDPERAR
jgi:nucleoside-diphosphate-sugar epimerase